LDRRQTLPKKFRYALEYLVFRILLWPLQMLSLNAVNRLGRFLGTTFYHCTPSRRRIARVNLDVAFGNSKSPDEKNRITKQSMIHMMTVAIQGLWITRNTKQRVHQLFPDGPEGTENLLGGLEKGKGVLCLMAHYGNWEAFGIFWGYTLEARINSVARKLDNRLLEDYLARLRAAPGNGVFHKEEAPRKILRALKANQLVGIMLDQNGGVHGLFVDFFGKKAATARSLALLCYSSGASVVPTIPFPKEDGTYRAVALPEIQLDKTGDKETDIFRWTQAYQKVLEDVIRKQPEPWMWIHRRWKTRPPDEQEPGVY